MAFRRRPSKNGRMAAEARDRGVTPWREQKALESKARREARRKKKAFEEHFCNEARVRWIKSRPCDVTGEPPPKRGHENAHVKSTRGSGLGDYMGVITASDVVHREMHQHGQAYVESKYRVDLERLADAVEAEWRAKLRREEWKAEREHRERVKEAMKELD